MITITQKIAQRLLVGRRIVAVDMQRMDPPGDGSWTGIAHHVVWITLDDGARLSFGTAECGPEYATEIYRHPPKRARGAR